MSSAMRRGCFFSSEMNCSGRPSTVAGPGPEHATQPNEPPPHLPEPPRASNSNRAATAAGTYV